eukprot:3997399-Pleurochrysis_carterae.AAC.3
MRSDPARRAQGLGAAQQPRGEARVERDGPAPADESAQGAPRRRTAGADAAHHQRAHLQAQDRRAAAGPFPRALAGGGAGARAAAT